jgi:HK97 family phage portal protein
MANKIQAFFNSFIGNKPNDKDLSNALFGMMGGKFSAYDNKKTTILEKGYGINPDVFAIVNKSALKAVSIPYEIKKVKDKKSLKKLKSFEIELSPIQLLRKQIIESEAYENDTLEFPMEQPNPLQTWSDIFSLYKTYIDVVGDFYLYMICPEDGTNKGVPKQCYALPADKMQIVLKKDVDLMSDESPIDYYLFTEGTGYIEFPEKDVIHIKTVNPFYSLNGSHLYGLSRLQAALRNIQSSNASIDNNNKTMANSGVFGFIHGKQGGTPLTPEQAQSLKQRLLEMDRDPGRLANIAGGSGEIAFTRISLTTDELKPFDFLNYDRGVICNALNFPLVLLGQDDKSGIGSSDRTIEAKKTLVVDNIMPDLKMLAESLQKHFFPRFKGFENCVMDFDISELPEMQQDMTALVGWLEKSPITKNEFRVALKYLPLQIEGMDSIYLPMNLQAIDAEITNTNEIDNAFNE